MATTNTTLNEAGPGWTCRDGRPPVPYTSAELVAVVRTLGFHDSDSTVARLIATIRDSDREVAEALVAEIVAAENAAAAEIRDTP